MKQAKHLLDGTASLSSGDFGMQLDLLMTNVAPSKPVGYGDHKTKNRRAWIVAPRGMPMSNGGMIPIGGW
jgi:hypothetical protein